MSLDAAGDHLSSRRFGDLDSQIGRGVAVMPNLEGVYVTGYTRGTTDFGVGEPLVSAGEYDIVLARLDP